MIPPFFPFIVAGEKALFHAFVLQKNAVPFIFVRFGVFLFKLPALGGKVDFNRGALAVRRFDCDFVAELCENLFGQIQTDAGGFFVSSAVVAGETALKNARQILRRDAHAVVAHKERVPLAENRDPTARRVFDGVGEDLLDAKTEPFFISQHPGIGRDEIERDFAADKERRVFAHCLPHNVHQYALTQNIVGGVAAHAQVGEHHFHILLDAENLREQFAARFGFFICKNQPCGGDRRFDLVHPHGVVVDDLPLLLFRLGDSLLPLGADRPHKRWVIGFNQTARFGQLVAGEDDCAEQVGKETVTPVKMQKIRHGRGDAAGRAETGCVQHGLDRQMIQRKNRREQNAEYAEQRDQFEL